MIGQNRHVMIVGGGTGGHFFPAFAVAEELCERDYTVTLITDQRCKSYIPIDVKFSIIVMDFFPLAIRKGVSFFVKNVIMGNLSSTIALYRMLRSKPVDLAIGYGGYTSVPLLLLAKIFGIKILIHEQNAYIGKANKLLAYFAEKFILSFDKCIGVPNYAKDKTVVLGNPLRKSIESTTDVRDFNSEVFQIFVTGGSQGAKIFDEIIPAIMSNVRRVGVNTKIKIVQQSSSDADDLIAKYTALGIEAVVQKFFSNMHDYYCSSHLFIGRAGAMTVSEVISTGIPAIFIPYPYAGNHQSYNALNMSDRGLSYTYQQDLTDALNRELISNVSAVVGEVIENRAILQDMSEKIVALKQDARANIADLIEKYFVV